MATATASEVAAALTVEFSAHGKKKSNSAFAVLALKDVHVKQGHNPRRNIGDLTELESGVKREGLINPITVRPQSGKDAKEGRYWIVAGERRYRAVKALGYDSIPAVIRFDLENDEDARLVAVCENGDGRTDLTHAELGYAFKEALGAGLKPGEIASRTGMNHMKVRRCLDLIEAPEKIQKKVESGELSLMAGLEYAAMEDDSLRKTVERKLEQDGVESPSAAAIKRAAKDALRGKVETTPGKKASRKDSPKQRSAAMVTWQPSRAKQLMIQQVCYAMVNPDVDETERDFNTAVGALAWALWDRGDLPIPDLPLERDKNSQLLLEPPADATADEKKRYKSLLGVIKAEAEKYSPPADENDAEGSDTGK